MWLNNAVMLRNSHLHNDVTRVSITAQTQPISINRSNIAPYVGGRAVVIYRHSFPFVGSHIVSSSSIIIIILWLLSSLFLVFVNERPCPLFKFKSWSFGKLGRP